MKLMSFPYYSLSSQEKEPSSGSTSGNVQNILDISKFQKGETIPNIERYETFLHPYDRTSALAWLGENTHFGIGNIIGIHKDKGFVEGDFGFAYFDIYSGEIYFNSGNLGIGKLKSHKNLSGVYVGECGIARIDYEELQLIFTTGDLGKGEIAVLDNDGFIVFKKGPGCNINLETGEIVT